jgi:vanillate/3-O-methylgallate O-demethylase
MSQQSLEQVFQGKNPVDVLRNSQIGAYVYPQVPTEFSNWRDEQKAWRDTAVLFDQSHHMAELLVTGPDAQKMLSYLASNSFKGFVPNRAKQFAPLSYDGYVIGDVILFYHGENEFNLVGRAPTVNWVEFHAKTGGFNVQARRDDRSPGDAKGKAVNRNHYRYQIQGPNAKFVLEKLNGGPVPDVKFFHMDFISISGKMVLALRHGMAGEPGLEIW